MTDASVETPGWSRQRWWLTILCMMALQTSLIFLLEKHSGDAPARRRATPLVQLRPNLSLERFLVSDPTVFVLPHRHGFSGEAWLDNLPSPDFQPAGWSEPPRALALLTGGLGANFSGFVAANASPPFETMAAVKIPPSRPVLYPVATVPPKSLLKIEDTLSLRKMVTELRLPAWESADLVTNSVVQLLVDNQGKTISAVLLSPGIRLKKQEEADASALELAKAARFEPAAAPTVGTMIFEWQTVAPASTNALEEIP